MISFSFEGLYEFECTVAVFMEKTNIRPEGQSCSLAVVSLAVSSRVIEHSLAVRVGMRSCIGKDMPSKIMYYNDYAL